MAKDIALFNILTNNLMSVAREMSADFLRSAYSVVIREAADCSTFLADAKGRILAQPQDQPLHMNSVSRALTGALSKIDATNLTEDDAIILNDPYSGGQHLSDIYIFSPIVHDGKLVAFAGTTGHHADLGTRLVLTFTPGIFLRNGSVFAPWCSLSAATGTAVF